jgi:ubiquinone/menaquinone biosynthesis C-methylase UbiE
MKRSKPWWESQFLDPVITEVMFGWKTDTKAEVDQILKELRLPVGAHLLDLACGQGRHSIELAKRGFRVTGLDYSSLLLSRAIAAAERLAKSKRPTFVEGDMRDIKRIFPTERFDAVVSLWNAWGYFDRRSDDRKTLAGISHVLKKGGLLLINTLNESGVIHRLRSDFRKWHEEKGGRYFLQEFDYDRSTKKTNSRWILIGPNEKHKEYSFSQNVYSTQDFRKELRRVGLRMTKLWGQLAGKPYSRTSWHQTFVARKVKQ